MSTKECSEFFLFCLDLEIIDKPGFYGCVETRSFLILAINSNSKQNKKNSEHTFVEIGE